MQTFRRALTAPLGALSIALALTITACGSATSSTTSHAASGTSSMPGMQGSSTMSSTAMAPMPAAMPRAASVACAPAPPGSRTLTTGSRIYILSVGPEEHMYSPQQVRRAHPKGGEMMLSGHMQTSGMSGMSGGSSMSGMGSMRHLEVHICTRHGRKVVTRPMPKIMLTSGRMTQMIPVATMEGVREGVADLHFGNNVELERGHVYKVDVTEGSDHAMFHFTAG